MVQVDTAVGNARNNGPDLIIAKSLGHSGARMLVQRPHFLKTAIGRLC